MNIIKEILLEYRLHNDKELTTYLEELITEKEIQTDEGKKLIRTKLYKIIANPGGDAYWIKDPEEHTLTGEYDIKDFKNKTLKDVIMSNDFKESLSHYVDNIRGIELLRERSKKENNKQAAIKIKKAFNTLNSSYDWETLLTNANDLYHKLLATFDIEEGTTKTIVDYKDGFKLVQLLDASECEYEGSLMSHCVATFGDKVEKRKTKIFSLRDKDNKPHVTIEITKTKKNVGGTVAQIKAKSDSVPHKKYATYLKTFFDIVKPENISSSDFYLMGLILSKRGILTLQTLKTNDIIIGDLVIDNVRKFTLPKIKINGNLILSSSTIIITKGTIIKKTFKIKDSEANIVGAIKMFSLFITASDVVVSKNTIIQNDIDQFSGKLTLHSDVIIGDHLYITQDTYDKLPDKLIQNKKGKIGILG